MRIALIPGSFKPYHAGHDALIRKAASENDRVIVFYSTADRARPGELAVSGENSSRIMNEYVSRSLPGNVNLVASKVPVRSVFELLTEVDSISNDSYAIYSDSEDIARYRTISKYAPNLANSGRIDLKDMARGEDSPNISGTAMRKFIMTGDVDAFRMGLPLLLRPQAEEIFDLLGGAYKRPLDLKAKSESYTRISKNIKKNVSSDIENKVINSLLHYSRASKSQLREQKTLNRTLLEDFVDSQTLLLEFYSGYDDWGSGDFSLIYKAFIEPFVNVGKAIGATALDVTNAASIPLRVIAAKLKGKEGLVTAINGYKDSKAAIENIWAPILKFNDEAMSGDAQLVAFGLNPQAFVSLKMAKSFKNIIAGKANDAKSGLIGTLAEVGFLPDVWVDKWVAFKTDRVEQIELSQRAASRKSVLERREALLSLEKHAPPLIATLLASKIKFSTDAVKDESIRKKLTSIKNAKKEDLPELLNSRMLEDFRMLIEKSDLPRSKKQSLNEQIDLVDSRLSTYLSSMRSLYRRYNLGGNLGLDEINSLKNLPEQTQKFLRETMLLLRQCIEEFLPTATIASILFSTNSISSIEQELSANSSLLKTSGFNEDFLHIRERLEEKKRQLASTLDKSGQPLTDDVVAKEMAKFEKSVLNTLKMEIAKVVVEKQTVLRQQIGQISDSFKTQDEKVLEILRTSPAANALLTIPAEMEKLMTQIQGGVVKQSAVSKIEMIKKKIDEILRQSK
jgi:hypothetical protein